MNVAELAQWVGKYVRTEDDSMFNCGSRKDTPPERHSPRHSEFCGPDDKFGGQGWVLKFEIDERGICYLCTDEGLSWIVTSNTKIIQARVPRHPFDEDAAAIIRRTAM